MSHVLLPPRANFFDASALVKVFSRESDTRQLRQYWDLRSPGKHTTPFCFYEALSVLKGKWFHRKEISKEAYLEASTRLFTWYQTTAKSATDVDLHDVATFQMVRDLAERHSLDLSDALQIISVRDGRFSRFADDSKTILITADKALACAARVEGLRVWHCTEEPEP